MFTVGRKWENKAVGLFYHSITGGSELKKNVAFSRAWNEYCGLHTVHNSRKICFILVFNLNQKAELL